MFIVWFEFETMQVEVLKPDTLHKYSISIRSSKSYLMNLSYTQQWLFFVSDIDFNTNISMSLWPLCHVCPMATVSCLFFFNFFSVLIVSSHSTKENL